ncbi:alpha/beta hydrolase family protein [Parathalassolituus penaei]|uniref:Alpha/beta hydrolase n=1 Tax=Parathalassolituus penaei TaxID=2997323 RepID=A0A9X3IS52_9GAMM|nr:alpha/beta family hydrolase [Parathalassolituus penaei]MCY0964524.1 alpha/beta hydrolase [Parathalassolituus penaei]
MGEKILENKYQRTINERFFVDGYLTDPCVLLLHGSGAGCEHEWMVSMARRLAAQGLLVLRTNFAWMEKAVARGKPCPPPRADKLVLELELLVLEIGRPLVIVGKSLGGRIGSMLVAESASAASGYIRGTVCLGYPFHSQSKPEQWRTAHWPLVGVPMLVMQGESDPFGRRDEVEAHLGSGECGKNAHIQLQWWPDGDHDLLPRKRSGISGEGQLQACAQQIGDFVRALSV